MKKKITVQLCLVGAISIVFTSLFSMLVYFNLFQKQVYVELETYIDILDNIYEKLSYDDMGKLINDDSLRITLIANDGKVLYDNSVSASLMQNHMERPEIIQAFESGEGKAIRTSSTVLKNTYYYARMLNNGDVLRVSTEASGLVNLFGNVIPVIIVCGLVLFIICICITRMLTMRIIRPINKFANDIVDIENIEQSVPYEELKPFAKTIWTQHEDIKKQLNRLERSERVRQEFTANVSHELKTPLTSISGYAELIEQGMAKEEDAKRFAGEILRNSNRLFTLINDIIKLSEMDENGIRIPKETIDLYQIAKECVHTLELNAKQQSITVTLKGEKCLLTANKSMMEELVMNLCDNAVRYNKVGGSVFVEVLNNGDVAQLIVKDTGIGIKKQHQERIFERFYRVDKSRSKETGGTGLGLAIVKHILVKHNARVVLESEFNVGTTIKVDIPKKPEKLEET